MNVIPVNIKDACSLPRAWMMCRIHCNNIEKDSFGYVDVSFLCFDISSSLSTSSSSYPNFPIYVHVFPPLGQMIIADKIQMLPGR